MRGFANEWQPGDPMDIDDGCSSYYAEDYVQDFDDDLDDNYWYEDNSYDALGDEDETLDDDFSELP